MALRPNHNGGNKAVALLATCFVVLGGAISCAAIAVAADPLHPESTLVPVAGVVVGIIFLLWILRDKPPETGSRINWGWLARRSKRKVAYKVQPKVPPSERASAPPAPPTAESIRAITGRQSTWVPSPTSGARDPRSP
jgi:hypothetical protein